MCLVLQDQLVAQHGPSLPAPRQAAVMMRLLILIIQLAFSMLSAAAGATPTLAAATRHHTDESFRHESFRSVRLGNSARADGATSAQRARWLSTKPEASVIPISFTAIVQSSPLLTDNDVRLSGVTAALVDLTLAASATATVSRGVAHA
jgi:hypothetical protein